MISVPASPDDTQPVKRSAPAGPAARKRWLLQRGRWWLTALILTTTCTLMATLVLFVRAIPVYSPDDSGDRLTVSIRHAGALQRVSTAAETVGALLAEQDIGLPANSQLSHPAAERLSEGMVINIAPAREVEIVEEGRRRIVVTALENPLDILRHADIALSDADRIWVNGALADYDALPGWTVPARHIRIRRANRVTVIDDGQTAAILSNADTVGAALLAAGVKLYHTDEVSPPLDSAISGALTISIKRAIPIELAVDGVVVEARTNAERVADVLAEQNAPLFGLDYLQPAGDTAVSEGMRIEIMRVTEEVETVSEFIPHEDRVQPDAELTLDQSAVVQAGRDGLREIRSRIRYENGVEVSRDLLESTVVEAPQNRIVAYGTKVVPLGTVNTPAGPRQYWRRLCMYTTSYNPVSNGGNLNTSTGATLSKGVIASKPNIIPYHTRVFVPNYGNGAILDTGGGPSGTDYWVDLGYGENEGFKPWRAYTWVYHLMPPPERITYRLPGWTPNSRWPGNCG
ncbi:MAG: DUF348 domain-containing protein [Chloroflexi bacterium]|nr:DUF348 domain-containing protein [Chloroflexota bacterium]